MLGWSRSLVQRYKKGMIGWRRGRERLHDSEEKTCGGGKKPGNQDTGEHFSLPVTRELKSVLGFKHRSLEGIQLGDDLQGSR